MKFRLLVASALLCIVVAVPSAPAEEKPAVRTISSSGVTSAGTGKASYGVSTTSLMVRDSQPIACYGITKAKGESEKYAYFIVFKSPPGGKDQPELQMGGGTSMDDTIEATESPTITLGKKKWGFRYQLKANGDLTKVTSETLTIDGKAIKTSEARVFLVDFTNDKPTVQVLKIEPSKKVPDLAQKNDPMKVIEEAVDELKKQSKEVREFLEPAKK